MEITEEKRSELVAKTKQFLKEKYKKELIESVQEERALEVDFAVLDKFSPELGELLREEPDEFFSISQDAMEEMELPVKIEETEEEFEPRLRMANLPDQVAIRNLRSRHINRFLCTEGIVRKASEIRPEITSIEWECPSCGETITQEREGTYIRKPRQCECGNKSGFMKKDKNMVDTRWIVIEEPFELTEGEKPSQVTVLLTKDLVSPEGRRLTDPGNRLKINGILKEVPKGKSSSLKLDFYLDANHFEPTEVGWEKIEIKKEDEKKIKEVAKDNKVYDKLIGSLAPSLYGMDEVKESIILQMFGGVPRKLEDQTKFRGDIHILLVGDPASGKCVTGDTEVILKDGTVGPIKDIVEKKLKDNTHRIDDGYYAQGNDDLLSLGLDGRIEHKKANIFWKRRAPKHLYRVETCGGKEITVTPTHPFFVCQQGRITSKKAQELTQGDFVATPNRLPFQGKTQRIDLKVERTPANNANHINVPERTSSSLCRFIAYLLAEGYLQDNDTSSLVWFTNNNPQILKDFEECAGIFDIPVHKRKPHKGKMAVDYHLSSVELGDFLRKLEPSLFQKSKAKKIPQVIMKSGEEETSDFLRAFFDCEANISQKGIELTSVSRKILSQVQTLLLRFGINSQIHPCSKRANSPEPKYREYHRLFICGSNVEKFRKHIGFSRREKMEKLQSLPEKSSITDTVPNLSGLLKELRKKLRLTQFQTGIKRTTYQHFERGDRNPTKWKITSVAQAFQERMKEIKELKERTKKASWKEIKEIRNRLNLSQKDLAERAGLSQTLISQYELGKCGKAGKEPRRKDVEETTKKVRKAVVDICDSILQDSLLTENLKRIEMLAEADIYWDRIDKIERVPSKEKWVYDLQVPGTHNFVANQLFVHNSQLLKLAPRIIPRGKYVSGKGVTAAGLTASVSKDEQFMGGWVLEAGAIVLANKGLLAIDEFEKMTSDDQVAMHEALEQGCYHYGTQLTMENGKQIPIGDFVEEHTDEPEGDRIYRDISDKNIKILSTNFQEVKPSKVSAVGKHLEDRLFRIKLVSDHEITVTPKHPVFVTRENDMDIIEAKDIKESDRMPVVKGKLSQNPIQWVQVKDIEEINEEQWVYDVTVNPTRTFIGNGMVCHNSVSIAKASIVATLPAETSVLAGGNPKFSRFDPYMPISKQITVPDTLLSRFDLKFVLRDVPNPKEDKKIVEHILLTRKGDYEESIPDLDPGFIRKYISYAKENCKPELTDESGKMLKDFYLNTRKKAQKEGAPVPITLRQFEALTRLAEASAKIQLSDKVRKKDAQRAIRLMQFSLKQLGLVPETGEIDVDKSEGGIPAKERSNIRIVLDVVEKLSEKKKEIPVGEIEENAKKDGVPNPEEIVEKLKKEGMLFEPSPGYVQRV